MPDQKKKDKRTNDRERDWLIRLLNNPPPGSKLAAAKEYGIDLTLLVHNLELTPTERIRELIAAQPLLEELRRASKGHRS